MSHLRALTLLGVLGFGFALVAASAEAFDVSGLNCDNPELLGECLAGLAASRAKVETFRIDFEWKQTLPALMTVQDAAGNPLAIGAGDGTSTMLGRGHLRLKSTTKRLLGAPGSPVSTNEELSVRGSSYLVYAVSFPSGKGNVQQFEFEDLAEAGPRARELNQVVFGDDIMNYGFGDGETTLERHLSVHADVNRWTVQRLPDGTINIARYSSAVNTAAVPDCEWRVDPGRGWLITNVLNRAEDGSTDLHVRVEADLVNGIWFPVAYQREYADSLLSVRITKAELNKGVTDEMFEWPSFGAGLEGFHGFKSEVSGETTNFVVRGGLPIEAATSEFFTRDAAKEAK